MHAMQLRSILFAPSSRWRGNWTANELYWFRAAVKLPRKRHKARSITSGGLMQKVRKPMAPPAKVEEDLRKYNRARERQGLRRGKG
jgi:hypothetical protein